MIKRTIYLGSKSYLSLSTKQLVIKKGKEATEGSSIPIEDIGIMILDHSQITITQGLVNALIENNAAVLWCDCRHIPNGLILPLAGNHIYTEKIKHQIAASEPLKKQLWKQTVQAKIRNQAAVLSQLGFQNENLLLWAQKTSSGDSVNMEGRAAAWYWKCFFEYINKKDLTRDRDGDPPNNLLNYGYAILRAIVARSLVASGCLPALGIHHRNKYNAFCLADDIMEPYRPLVDLLVIDLIKDSHPDELPFILDKETKAHLLRIPTLDVKIKNATSPLMVGMQRTTASLMECFEGNMKKINYPELWN
ncbi:MAG: type II CRISPR-associated endonuclease Cas1 [Bacteroidota bacterium]